ncbi:MAG: tripartite tricarboxylate transporter TctB family protein [Spirochaetales bacterium]|jgi:hypothetical protein|nr:tripartite tricarboxylate transporter TctB family protein [Spirochaetales bacterium]
MMGELIVPILAFVIAVIFYAAAGSLTRIEGFPMNSATYPQALTVMLMICCVFLIVRFVIKHREYASAEKKLIFDPRIFLALGMLILFYYGLEYIGYIPSSILFIVALSWILKEGKPRILDTCILPIGLSGGLYFIFQFMGIYLPLGKLFRGLF